MLSVSGSDVGGFTKKGFSWTDYEFSFETKVIKEASGWIIRANGNDFLMMQLEIKNDKPRLRPHYHKEGAGTAIWSVDEDKSINVSEISVEGIKLMKWVRVRIVVDGNQVDVYLNGTHSLHYIINPIGVNVEKNFVFKDNAGREFEAKTNEFLPFGGYTAGRVGFRCGHTEHSHFKNVRVRPL